MAERGLYACYGFVLGFAFAVLGVVLALSVVRTQGAARHGSQSTIRKTVLRILVIAFPVALCFAVIFVFTVVEIATHRHGPRYEYYITSYLCSECVALAFMLFHFISAGLKARSCVLVFVCVLMDELVNVARAGFGAHKNIRLDGFWRHFQAVGQQGCQYLARRHQHDSGQHLGARHSCVQHSCGLVHR